MSNTLTDTTPGLVVVYRGDDTGYKTRIISLKIKKDTKTLLVSVYAEDNLTDTMKQFIRHWSELMTDAHCIIYKVMGGVVCSDDLVELEISDETDLVHLTTVELEGDVLAHELFAQSSISLMRFLKQAFSEAAILVN